MIQLSKLNKSYAGRPALIDVNLSIPPGEIFGIIGRSGAGKSTLLRCINLLERPQSGDVIIDQQSLMNLNPHQLRQARHSMGMIFQHFNLLSVKNVYDNIALPMRIQGIDEQTIRDKIHEVIELVELTHKIDAYPAQLSGGQKQRVAIARALCSSPQILLCDEATSALDPQSTESILALLKKINQRYQMTIVLITHEMDVIKRICHRVAVMDDGRIIEVNALAHVFEQKDSVTRQMLYKQLRPEIPPCLSQQLTHVPNHRPLLRIFFEGPHATTPWMSHASRELQVDINILLANIDRCEGITYGVLVVEISADAALLEQFIERCTRAHLTVEIVGYVLDHGI